jgi:hypothetical protein
MSAAHLFRRFDDPIEYRFTEAPLAGEILRRRLAMFEAADLDWPRLLDQTVGLSHAQLARASEEVAKHAVLAGSKRIASEALLSVLRKRRSAAIQRFSTKWSESESA